MRDEPDSISDLDIQALVDGELDDARACEVHRAISLSPAWQERFRQLQQQKELLQKWWTGFRQEH